MITRVTLATILAILTAVPALPQERFSFFQASTPESVERMLKLANLRDDDVVVDLGSGNGLIPLTAARMNRRLRGLGVDINAMLVDESNQQARSEGMGDRVRFEHRNAFDADLREATVVTMWLFPELMRLLRPVILERARPGTRVLTSTWDLGSWPPDKTDTDGGSPIYLWVVPARVAGGWHWDLQVGGRRINYASLLEQRFQAVDGVARAGDRREVLEGMTLQRRRHLVHVCHHARRVRPHAARVQRQGRRRSDRGDGESDAEGSADADHGVARAAGRALRLLRADRHRDVRAAGRQPAHDDPGIAVEAQRPVTSGLDSRCDQSQRRKVRPIAPRIAREQRQPGDRRVRTDVEVGHRRTARAPAAAVLDETLARQKRALPWQRQTPEVIHRQRGVEVFDALEPCGYLGVNDWIDEQGAPVGGLGEHRRGPVEPLVVLGQEVEQHVAVDERAVQTQPLVRRMISSVVIRLVARPLRCATSA